MGPAANAFRREVRAWLAQHWTAAQRAAHARLPFKDRGWDVEFSQLMGRDGWIGIGWPREFGGQARSPAEQIAFVTEMANAGAPCAAHGTGESVVAPALILHGTRAQQDEWLPAIARGERRSTMSTLIPACFLASGSVRTASQMNCALSAPVDHSFCPLTTQTSPSRTARVRSAARSEPASGSL